MKAVILSSGGVDSTTCLALAVEEYGANQIKKAVVGVGHAEKAQVDMMVHTLLPAAGKMKPDAADAAAAAICHSFLRVTKERLKLLSELGKK